MPEEGRQAILAIDLGTSAVKAALVTLDGEVLGWEQEPLTLHLFPGGGAEQDPQDWWRGIAATSRRLLGQGLVTPEAVIAVCATTQGAGTVPVDREGNPLMNCLTWLDSRGARHSKAFVRGLLNLDGFDLLRLLRWIRITGGAPAKSGKESVGHILYIKNEHPQVYAETYKFLSVLDYINLRLTGEFFATWDSIFDTWVTDNRDPAGIRYHPGLVKSSTIPADKYPELRHSTDVIGPLTPQAADELGLPPGVPVVAGALDYTSAAIGSGAVADYQAHLYLGTSSWIAVHVPYKKTDLFHYLASLPCAIPGRYLVTAAQELAGGSLAYLRDNLLFHQDGLLQASPSDYYRALNQVAEAVPPGSNGLIFTPWLYGERCPVDNAFLRGGIHNLSLANTRADLARAFFEGVALNTRWMLAPVEKFLGGRRIDPITIVGGGANSNLWCQIHADVLQRTIRQVKDPVQVNVRGAAFIAGVGLGRIRFADVPGLVQVQEVYTPDPYNRDLYDELFQVFLEIYKQNKGIYERLNRKK